MDNRAIASVLGEIASLLEIKGDNAFKIRAYASAADAVRSWPEPLAGMTDAQLREIPGVGKDLAAKIRELSDTGACVYHAELLQLFPATLLDVLALQGLGPKTVATLHTTLGICSVPDLLLAVQEGRLRGLKGIGPKKESQILKAIEERERDAGRHLMSDTVAMADSLLAHMRAQAPAVDFVLVGSARRGCETSGDIDIVGVGGDAALMDVFVAHPQVERTLARGDTKSSVRLQGGFQADLRLVPVESRGAAMQYFTGSKAHNIATRDRAIHLGFKLNEYGLFRTDDETRVAGDTEAGIYEALGMAWVEPALRENRGEIEAAVSRTLPSLVTAADLRGDLHMHTDATDGRDTLEAMAAAAHRLGHSYIAITDHSKALAMANGMDERRTLEHAARIRALNGRFEGLTLLAGIECDILGDGSLDLADDCLAQLDFVVASVHSHFGQDEGQMTDRVLRALENPWVDVLGHPTGRLLLRRAPVRLAVDRIIEAAAQSGVALEINCQVDRLDLDESHARHARERGVPLVLSTDAHSVKALGNQRWGLAIARRAWASAGDILNTCTLDDLRARLRRHRPRVAA